MRALIIAMALGALSGQAFAADPPQPRGQCFYPSQVNNFRAAGSSVLNVRVGVNDVYRLDLLGPCHDLAFAETIGVEGPSTGSPICVGLNATVIAPTTIGPRRCAVRSVTKLTPAEASALPRGHRP